MQRWVLLVSVVLVGSSTSVAQTMAYYTVEFEATWSESTHPLEFPENPHFSGLIGGTHDNSVVFWAPGDTASYGIERMAEGGRKSPLRDSVEAAIVAGSAEFVLSGGGIGTSPSSVFLDFEITTGYPLVTLVSMLAPSPDWFVGVHGLSLRDGGEWIDSLDVVLRVYDAGTDSAETYVAFDVDINPHIPIVLSTAPHFATDNVVGVFRFRRRIATLDASVFIEGAYADGDSMSAPAAFELAIPLNQPYADPRFDGTVIDYDGPESVIALPDSVIDWMLVSLRTTPVPEDEIPGSRQSIFLRSDGVLMGLDGGPVVFEGVGDGSYHVVIRHRNHLGVMSRDPVVFAGGFGSIDFTADSTLAYVDGGPALTKVGSGVYAMPAGDVDIDGQVTASDFNTWLTDSKSGLTGYQPADFNLDGVVTAGDFNLFLANTKAGLASQVP